MPDSPLTIHIEVDADDTIKALGRLAAGLRGQDLMEGIGAEVAKFSRDRITGRRNTAPDGSQWEPLVLSTILRKKKKGLGHQGTLMERGRLWWNIQAANATEDTVDVGSDCVYARVHQLGGKTGRGHAATIPARPYLGVSRDEEPMLQRWIEMWVKDLLEGD